MWKTDIKTDNAQQLLHCKPFKITHSLQDSPLFSFDSLVELAQEMTNRRLNVYYDAGPVAINDKWGDIPIPKLPMVEVLKNISQLDAWIVMKQVEHFPEYKTVLDQFTEFVHAIAGPTNSRYLTNPEMLIIVTSPRRLTSFHFDAEPNFLIQVSGDKNVWICDPFDRSITTEEEIERYYAIHNNAGTYKAHAEDKAWQFKLHPGDGVHIPTHGAHWVRNGEAVSISLSLNFEFPRWMYRDVYRANYYLRRCGIDPQPPGRSKLRDRTKYYAISALTGVRNTLARNWHPSK